MGGNMLLDTSPMYRMSEAGYMDLLRQMVPLELAGNTEQTIEEIRLIESTIRYIEELTEILEDKQ